MLPTIKYGLMGAVVGVVLGSLAAGGYSWMSSGSKDSATGADSSYTPSTPSTTYGGAKTKHNRKHNNKSRKHH